MASPARFWVHMSLGTCPPVSWVCIQVSPGPCPHVFWPVPRLNSTFVESISSKLPASQGWRGRQYLEAFAITAPRSFVPSSSGRPRPRAVPTAQTLLQTLPDPFGAWHPSGSSLRCLPLGGLWCWSPVLGSWCWDGGRQVELCMSMTLGESLKLPGSFSHL